MDANLVSCLCKLSCLVWSWLPKRDCNQEDAEAVPDHGETVGLEGRRQRAIRRFQCHRYLFFLKKHLLHEQKANQRWVLRILG